MTWRDRARCANEPVEMFFPRRGKWDAQRAKELCFVCPVRYDCLGEALRIEQPGYRAGIWGGYTPRERSKLAYRYGTAFASLLASRAT